MKRCSEVTYVIRKLGGRKENIAHYNRMKPYTHRRPRVPPGNTQPRSPPTSSPPTSVDKAQENQSESEWTTADEATPSTDDEQQLRERRNGGRPRRQPRMLIRLDDYIIDTDMT